MTHGADTWILTKQAQNKLAATQTKMERSILNITYKHLGQREDKVVDIISYVKKMKWSWAGHINRLKDDRRTLHAYHTTVKDYKGDEPSDGEMTWTNT